MTAEWKALLEQSAVAFEAGKQSRRDSARYLWLGAKAAIKTWKPATDVTGDKLYRRTLTALGGSRKGSASKIRTVALASVAYNLDIDAYGSLNAAYTAAHRMGLGEEADLDPVCCCTCHHRA